MPTLYIHIGHEKTGTTAIQKFFDENRDKLKKKGILYPETGFQSFVQSALVNCIHPLDNGGKYLEFFPDGVCQDPSMEWGKLINDINSWGKDAFISSEHFISRLGVKGISYIKSILSEQLPNYDIKILSFFRRQDKCFTSRLSTLAKAGASQPYTFWLNQVMSNNKYYDYLSLVDLWANSFGSESIIIKPYIDGKDVIDDVLDAINIVFQTEKKIRGDNASWGPLTIEIGLMINQICSKMSVVEKRDKLSKLDRFLRAEEYSSMGPGKNLISFQVAKDIIERYQSVNDAMAIKYNNGNSLFQYDINESDYVRVIGSIDSVALIRILFRIFN